MVTEGIGPGSGIRAAGLWPATRRVTSLGIGIPANESSAGSGGPRFVDMLAAVEACASVGLEAVWIPDHFNCQSDEGPRGAWDAWTLMAGLAARVPDIHFGPMVACTGFRNPGVIVKMTEMIDEISNGRFILGLGAGWYKPDYDQFGLPMEPRVSRFEEAIHIIHGLLREGSVDFQGTYYQANEARNLPRGPRPGGPPILVGSSGDRMLGILVRYADAWDTTWGGDTEGLKGKVAKLEAACRAEGRDPATVVRSVGVRVAGEGFSGDPEGVLPAGIDGQLAVLEELSNLGFSHIRMGLQPFSRRCIDALAGLVEAFYDIG